MQCTAKVDNSFLKGTRFRFFLTTGAFLLFFSSPGANYNFNDNCQRAFQNIISLQFTEAQRLIHIENRSDPSNLIPLYLENYIDFLTLVIGEDPTTYNALKVKRSPRIRALEKGDKNSPYYRFCLGEVNLQWALARIKFGDYTAAAFEIRKAYGLLRENESMHPDFLINKTGLGMIHVITGIIPENYQWIVGLMGIDGSLDQGMEEIRQVASWSGTDRISNIYKTQALFYLAFLSANLEKNSRDALALLPVLQQQQTNEQEGRSPLLIFARATILMKNGRNDEALAVLQERNALTSTFSFYYLDFVEGIARLNRLDYTGSEQFERFLKRFRGQNYLRAACQKLAWIAILKGDTMQYHAYIGRLKVTGASNVDEDKQALHEAAKNVLPNVVLLRARLLFDGGYYSQALNQLLDSPLKKVIRSKHDLVEYTYRLGRIYHASGNDAKAIEYYDLTIRRGKKEPSYFAAGSAFQLGLVYENKGDYGKAEAAYRMCLSIDTPEYKTSLGEKARAGLNRMKKKIVRT